MDSVVLEPLNSLERHLNSLVTSLTQTNAFTNAPQIAKDLISDDDDLTASLNLLQRHQQNYGLILTLRAQVASLQDQLKDTVRHCVALRQEIGQLQPSILNGGLDSEDDDDNNNNNNNDTYDEEEEDTKVAGREVDYHTLLAFAARIGKHNAVAAREAEAEAVKRKIAAKHKTKTLTTTTTNGVGGGVPDATGNEHEQEQEQEQEHGNQDQNQNENATAETEAELERINNTIALTRAQIGMAFPDANVLRVGALGQLQLFQEQQQQQQQHSSIAVASGTGTGTSARDQEVQAAVEREVERLVRETEDIAEAERTEEAEDDDDQGQQHLGIWPTSPGASRRRRSIVGDLATKSAGVQVPSHVSASASASHGTGVAAPGAGSVTATADAAGATAPKPRRKLDLDFPSSDDED